MTSFALITEGITDQIVLETLIQGYYSEALDDEIDITALQPLRDETDKARQGNHGGWETVLEYCACTDRVQEALAFNDYLIIQIDTDCGDHVNFGVPLTHGGKDREPTDVIADTVAKLRDRLTDAVFEPNRDKFIFAVAVHSIECWLVPLHEMDAKKKGRTKSCDDHLQSALHRKGLRYEKTYPAYEELVSPYRKPKVIKANRRHNESLDLFLGTLPELE